MTDEQLNMYAYIKQIENEIKSLLQEREMIRQKLCEEVPGIENVLKEMELKPVEGGQNEINKTKIL